MIAPIPPSQAMRFNPDTSYLEELDAFVVYDFLEAWPQTGDTFLAHLAMNMREGSYGEIGLGGFGDLVASVANRQSEDSVARIHLTFVVQGEELRVKYQFVSAVTNALLPIEADNPGSFAYAMRWFSQARPRIELCISRYLFWVEAAR